MVATWNGQLRRARDVTNKIVRADAKAQSLKSLAYGMITLKC